MSHHQNIKKLLHDLRSPLAALSLTVELFEKEKLGTLNEKQKNMTASMKQSVDKLTKMIAEYKEDNP